MANYVFMNGKKYYLFTEKQAEKAGLSIEDDACEENESEKKLLADVPVGDTCKIGEREFIVLEHNDGETFVLLKDLYKDGVEFGSNNNYNGSNVDNICNEFAEEVEKDVGVENLCTHTVDLTADDGMKCFGSVERRASLMTANMCRKYVEILDAYKIDDWWWTCTAYSTPKREDSSWIKCVAPYGCVSSDSYLVGFGVRPFCILKSNIFVS